MHAPHDDPISGILSYCVLDAYEEYTILVWTSDGRPLQAPLHTIPAQQMKFTRHAPNDDPISGILSYCVLDAYEEYTILVWTSDGCLSHSLSLFFNMCHSCSLSTGIHTIAASLLFRILWNVKQ